VIEKARVRGGVDKIGRYIEHGGGGGVVASFELPSAACGAKNASNVVGSE